MARRRHRPEDPTLLAIPLFWAGMGLEYLALRRRSRQRGPTAADYEWRDTLTSLSMGTASLVTPLVLHRLLRPFAWGRGRYARTLAAATAGTAALTTVADLVVRGSPGPPPTTDGPNTPGPDQPAPARPIRTWARRLAATGGVASVVMGGLLASATWGTLTSPRRLWGRRLFGRRGTGTLALTAAIAGWDFLYYWNHRLGHERRYLWAVHVVHHSSERYNYATALRQPVAEELGPALPYGLLCLFGVAPEAVAVGRAVNLVYQFWIHTEVIERIGRWAERIFNSPSHHRVHHGSNPRYLDRNYGSILIVWDRLFGTFEPESEPVVYGLTKNIETFNLGRVALHDHAEMLRGVARSRHWGERLSYVLREPGWAYRHEAERAVA